MLRLRSFFVLASFFVLSCSNSGRMPLPAPGTPPPIPEELEADPLLRFDRLLPLRGVLVQMRYVPGSLDRAERARQRLEGICDAMSKIAKPPYGLHGIVLDREEWEKSGLGASWGLPARVEDGIWAVAAEGDADTVARMVELTGGWLPPLGGEPLRGTVDEAASLMVSDAILQTAVVREFFAARGPRGGEPWVSALVVQLAARLAWETTDPGQMIGVAFLFDRFAAARPGPRRLADYRDGLPLADDLAFQADFVRGADLVWVEKGPLGTRNLLRKAIKDGVPITLADLEDEAPGLAAWRRETFAH